MKYVINGRFLTRKTTGVERYAYEILLELDRLVPEEEVVVAVPKGDIAYIDLKRIKIRVVGAFRGNLWEQIDLPIYIIKNKALGIHLCNVAPLIKTDIVCIHDMNIRVHPNNYKRSFVWWYRVQYKINCSRAKKIITVSRFSEKEIEKYYPDARGKIVIVENGWQHMKRVTEDESIFDKLGLNCGHAYFFALSSMAPNKNLAWILRAAEKYPEKKFVIAGKMDAKVFESVEQKNFANVIYSGYVSDGEAKALMRHCEAFLFPSFYEGFGIPPMEALSVGADIIVSDIPVLHEIYGKAAIYVDPNGDGTIGDHIRQSVSDKDKILHRYSYEKSAHKLYELIR